LLNGHAVGPDGPDEMSAAALFQDFARVELSLRDSIGIGQDLSTTTSSAAWWLGDWLIYAAAPARGGRPPPVEQLSVQLTHQQLTAIRRAADWAQVPVDAWAARILLKEAARSAGGEGGNRARFVQIRQGGAQDRLVPDHVSARLQRQEAPLRNTQEAGREQGGQVA